MHGESQKLTVRTGSSSSDLPKRYPDELQPGRTALTHHD
jgi:hypothetical protein